ncbi:hypothetical protein OIU78_000645 [Salix suchowensis]|nr:hypothetical protein OIU78_000645 [Salix suchowensis]
MSSSMHQIISARQLLLFSLHSFMVCTIIPVCRASVTKNPDQALDPRELGTGIKCGSCPCVNPCSQLVPPPPPPSSTATTTSDSICYSSCTTTPKVYLCDQCAWEFV